MTIAFTITKPAAIGTAINASDVNTPVSELEAIIEDVVNGVQEFESLRFFEIAAPTNPSSGEYRLYFKSGTSGKLYARDNAGTEVLVFDFAAGGVALDVLQVQVFS